MALNNLTLSATTLSYLLAVGSTPIVVQNTSTSTPTPTPTPTPAPVITNPTTITTSDSTPQVGESAVGNDPTYTGSGTFISRRAWLLGGTVLTNSANIQFTQTGQHTFSVTVMGGDGQTTTSNANVTVAAATVTPTPAPTPTPTPTPSNAMTAGGETMTTNGETMTAGVY